MKKRHFGFFYIIVLGLLLVGCKPEQIGFLDDHLRYGVAEVQVVQGSAVTTNPIIANGSTTPMTVKLLAVRNKQTGEVVPDFLVEQEFSVYLGQVGNNVTTLEQLNALIGTDRAPSVTVNEIGGKVVLTPATENIPPGLYTVDVEITNIAGVKSYNGILDVNLIRLKPDSLYSYSANSSSLSSESEVTSLQSQQYDVKIQYLPDGENKIIFMWIDKDGKPFNPEEGQVIRRASLPSFADWSPFYTEELTDTAIVYPYPYFKGLPYPVKTSALVGSTSYTNFSSNYRIVGDYTDLGRNLNTSAVARFFKPGTHIIRYTFKDITFKLPNLNRTIIEKDVVLPISAPPYAAIFVPVDTEELFAGLTVADMVEFDEKFAAKKISFNLLQTDGSRNPMSTALAPGMWVDGHGNTANWGDGARLYSEFKRTDWQFNIGLFPEGNAAGDTFVVKQSFAYVDEDEMTNEVVYVFNIKVQ